MNNFTNPPSGHPPIRVNDITVGLIFVSLLTFFTLFFMWATENHDILFHNNDKKNTTPKIKMLYKK